MTRVWTIPLAIVVALVVVLAPAAAPDRKPPRIVAAAMIDADNDARADRVRLTYSERVRHAADSDGRYPFTVAGYRILSVGKATGKALVLLLVEQPQPDPAAAPTIRYRRTTDAAGQGPRREPGARAAVCADEAARARAAPAAAIAASRRRRRRRHPDADDCAPKNAAIHPGATDLPDLGFVDSNCDGIDGTEPDAIFASPSGNDANPGTKAKPKREIAGGGGAPPRRQEALRARRLRQLRTRVTSPPASRSTAATTPTSWQRRDRYPDGLPLISGQPEGGVRRRRQRRRPPAPRDPGNASGGRRATKHLRHPRDQRLDLTLQRVAVSAGDGTAGAQGGQGQAGGTGGAGGDGGPGACDGVGKRSGGARRIEPRSAGRGRGPRRLRSVGLNRGDRGPAGSSAHPAARAAAAATRRSRAAERRKRRERRDRSEGSRRREL